MCSTVESGGGRGGIRESRGKVCRENEREKEERKREYCLGFQRGVVTSYAFEVIFNMKTKGERSRSKASTSLVQLAVFARMK